MAATRERSEWERETRVAAWRSGTRSAEARGIGVEKIRRTRTKRGRWGRGARRRRQTPARVIGGGRWRTGDGISGFDLILKSNLERPRLLIRWVLSGPILLGSFDRPWNGVDRSPNPTTHLSPGKVQIAKKSVGQIFFNLTRFIGSSKKKQIYRQYLKHLYSK